MKYKIINDYQCVDRNSWSQFVRNHPKGNIFQTPEMYELYVRTKNYEPILVSVIDNKNNEIYGILLAVIQKEHTGFIGKFSSRSIIWGGPLIKNNNRELLEMILREYKKIVSDKSIYSQIRNLYKWNNDDSVFISNGFNYVDHYDIHIDLTKSEDELFMSMSQTRRRNIRKAIKRGINISEIDLNNDDMFKETYSIIRRLYKSIGLPLPNSEFFKNSVQVLSKCKYLVGIGAFLKNELIGVRLVLCFNGLIYDWYAGAKDNFIEYRPNDVLPWAVMKWGMDNGYRTFDFGGAGKPGIPYGVRDYKLKFGGNLLNFGRFEYIHNNPLYKVGKLALKFYRL